MPDYPWQEFIVLSIAGTAGVLAQWPNLIEAGRARLAEMRLSPRLVAWMLLIQAEGVFLLALAIGLFPASRLGAGAVWLRAWMTGTSLPSGWLREGLLGLSGGLLLGWLLALASRAAFPSADARLRGLEARQPARQRGLSWLSALPEEVTLRLFLCSLIVWLLGWVWQDASGAAADGAWLAAITFSALGSGLNQLLTAGLRLGLNAVLVARVLLPQILAGWAFGWVYWQAGLEAAVLAHLGFEAGWWMVGRAVFRQTAVG